MHARWTLLNCSFLVLSFRKTCFKIFSEPVAEHTCLLYSKSFVSFFLEVYYLLRWVLWLYCVNFMSVFRLSWVREGDVMHWLTHSQITLIIINNLWISICLTPRNQSIWSLRCFRILILDRRNLQFTAYICKRLLLD